MSSRSSRGVAPVVGVVVLVAITVVLAAVVGAFAIGLGSGTDDTPQAAITADLDGNRIDLTNTAGDTLDTTELTVRISIDGQQLEHQPKVHDYGSKGFSGFYGPFSAFGNEMWHVGETAGIEIAKTTNSPQPTTGSTVVVRIYANGNIITTAKT